MPSPKLVRPAGAPGPVTFANPANEQWVSLGQFTYLTPDNEQWLVGVWRDGVVRVTGDGVSWALREFDVGRHESMFAFVDQGFVLKESPDELGDAWQLEFHEWRWLKFTFELAELLFGLDRKALAEDGGGP